MHTKAQDFASFYVGSHSEVRYCAGPMHGIDTLHMEHDSTTTHEELLIILGEKPMVKAWSREITPDGRILRIGARRILEALPLFINDIESGRYTNRFYDELKDYYLRNSNLR